MIPELKIISKTDETSSIDYKDGCVLLVDKPLEWTSFDVVNKIRGVLRHRYQQKKFKVGHNGTLDPMATGLLMIFTGKYTKRIPEFERRDKRYTGTIKFGCTTNTLDREGAEKGQAPIDHITSALLDDTKAQFIGESLQEIPIFSANKIKGKAMYKMARQGQVFKPKVKTVVFNEIAFSNLKLPFVDFDLECGTGTYIRAFARDLGQKMDSLAYLYSLRRTQIANFSVENAFSIEDICQRIRESK